MKPRVASQPENWSNLAASIHSLLRGRANPFPPEFHLRRETKIDPDLNLQNVICFLRPKSLKENVACHMEEEVSFTGHIYRPDVQARYRAPLYRMMTFWCNRSTFIY